MGLLNKFPKLQNCCCCVELRAGTIVIGIIGVLIYIGNLYENIRIIAHHGAHGEYIYNCVIFAIALLINILLLVGAIKRNAEWIAIYLWTKLVFFILFLVGAIGAFINGDAQTGGIILVNLIIEFYFWLCVNSFYMELQGGIRTVTHA